MPKNKVRYGLENLHFAYMKQDGTWETPIHIPGLVGFNANPDENDVEFYADNIKYYFRRVNNGYTGDVETALIPDEVLAEVLGWIIDSSDVLVEIADGKAKAFALLAQIQGDVKNRRFVYYNCQGGRPGQASTTQGSSADPQTETMPLEILPIKVGENYLVKAVVEQGSAAYADWFNGVYVPDGSTISANKLKLEMAISLAESFNAEDYTEESYSVLETALLLAEGVVLNTNATQPEINSATKDLNEAILALIPA